MAKSIQSLVSLAITSSDSFASACTQIKAQMGRKNADSVRRELLPLVAKHYGIDVVDGQKGKRFDSEHASYETAKTKLRDLVNKMFGVTRGGNGKKFVPLTRPQLALAKELAALDSEHRRAIWAKAAEIAKANKAAA